MKCFQGSESAHGYTFGSTFPGVFFCAQWIALRSEFKKEKYEVKDLSDRRLSPQGSRSGQSSGPPLAIGESDPLCASHVSLPGPNASSFSPPFLPLILSLMCTDADQHTGPEGNIICVSCQWRTPPLPHPQWWLNVRRPCVESRNKKKREKTQATAARG